jgi:NAD(P)-dependent dehydrogenase (short-subunit alcohol dehydrogenase family)
MSDLAARFAGRHVLVTGAGTGIGRAIALRLAAEGAQLSLLARRIEPLRATAREIETLGGAAAFARSCDVRSRADVDAAVGEACERQGKLHALVACSGIGGPNGPGASGSADRFDDLVATNLSGTYACLRAGERHLEEGTHARHLVAIASILARLGVAGYTGYCASKAGVCGLVRALAHELAPRNVQVNAVLPGWVETDMALEGLDGMARALGTDREGARKIALESVPLRRMGQPEDVAGLVAWLLSRDARGVTGASLDMNNGAWMS